MKQTTCRTFLIKQGMPTVNEAISMLERELRLCVQTGTGILKLIHGYGSSGKGGRLRTGIREYLDILEECRKISFYVCGEDFSIFNRRAIELLDCCDELRKDADLNRSNNGVTFVMLKNK